MSDQDTNPVVAESMEELAQDLTPAAASPQEQAPVDAVPETGHAPAMALVSTAPDTEQPSTEETQIDNPVDIVHQRVAALAADALTGLQRTINAFAEYTQQHMDSICACYWDTVMPLLTKGIPVQVVPGTELVSYNPEPDNPDSAVQIVRLSPDIPATEENVRAYGTAMVRVASHPCGHDLDKLGMAVTNTTASQLYNLLYNAAKGVLDYTVNGFANALHTQQIPASSVLLITPLRGTAHLSDDGRQVFFTFYLLYGVHVPAPATPA